MVLDYPFVWPLWNAAEIRSGESAKESYLGCSRGTSSLDHLRENLAATAFGWHCGRTLRLKGLKTWSKSRLFAEVTSPGSGRPTSVQNAKFWGWFLGVDEL
jgi:hypothetical protein